MTKGDINNASFQLTQGLLKSDAYRSDTTMSLRAELRKACAAKQTRRIPLYGYEFAALRSQ